MFKNEKTKQKAFDYCVYMMFSSYYKKTKCISEVLETNLYLHYKDMNDNQAVELEKEATVTILPWNDSYGCHGIQAKTDSTVVTVYIKKEAKMNTTIITVK